jgi:predicted acyl esterase
VLGVAALIALLVGGMPGARAVTAYTTEELYIEGGGPPLHTVVFRPVGATRVPVILQVTPYQNSGGQLLGPDPLGDPTFGPSGFAQALLDAGYAVVTVTLRGYGASGGCYDFGGPGEQADVVRAVKWSAGRPWSTGKVGMTGTSYDGMTQVMALAAHNEGRLGDELAAVIPKSPPTGYLNFWTNGVRNTGGGHGLSAFYLASDLIPPSLLASPEHHATALSGTAENPACYPDGTVGALSDDIESPYWAARELSVRAAGATVPTMWVQGFNDWNVRFTNAPPVYDTLRGPRRGIFGPWDHGIGGDGSFTQESIRWFDRWVKGQRRVKTGPPVLVQDVDGSWRTEETWPPADRVEAALPVLGGSYVDAGGNHAETGLPAAFPVQVPAPLPTGQGSWTFTTPLASDVRIGGVMRFTATVESLVPDVHLVVLVYDVDQNGNAAFVQRGAVRVPRSGPVEFGLYPRDWRFPAGHRIGVLVTGADDAWFEPGTSATPVSFGDAALTLPMLPGERERVDHGPFHPRGEHAPFPVDITGREVAWTPPPER